MRHWSKNMLNKKNLLTLSAWQGGIGLIIFAISYFFFHFVTDEGITFVWHPEAGKPFVTFMIATLGVLFIFGSAVCLMSALILFDEKQSGEKNEEN